MSTFYNSKIPALVTQGGDCLLIRCEEEEASTNAVGIGAHYRAVYRIQMNLHYCTL